MKALESQHQMITLKVVLVLSMVLASSQVFAQSGDRSRRTTIDFEDELIEGEVRKPELFYLLQKKQFNFKRLIKLRNDFIPEMKKTAEEIRRSGS